VRVRVSVRARMMSTLEPLTELLPVMERGSEASLERDLLREHSEPMNDPEPFADKEARAPKEVRFMEASPTPFVLVNLGWWLSPMPASCHIREVRGRSRR
jgi:hypothetical protein